MRLRGVYCEIQDCEIAGLIRLGQTGCDFDEKGIDSDPVTTSRHSRPKLHRNQAVPVRDEKEY